MERCPNCSTPARHGAKFCTTCGFRFDGGDEGSVTPTTSAESDPGHAERASDPAAGEFSSSEWPPAPTPPEDKPDEVDTNAAESAAYELDAGASTNADYAGFWPEPSSDPWPEPVAASDEPGEQIAAEPELASQPQAATIAPEPSQETGRAVDTRKTVNDLLDQLRDAISQIDVAPSPDLSGVVSDLEVAVTPPGALPPDDVAELREALFAARERPRDIDTVVDLTKRIDALAALVIAYDRTIAAIERSLASLKLAEPPADTPIHSHGPLEEE